MLKFTYHSLRRAKERGLNLNVIAEQVLRSRVLDQKIRIPAGNMTVVAKREGNELVVITAWENPEPARRIK